MDYARQALRKLGVREQEMNEVLALLEQFKADIVESSRLQQTLEAQDRNYDAGFVESEFRDSWKGGEVKLEDLM